MDFGKVDNIEGMDFTLPPDRVQTVQLLTEFGNKPSKKVEFYVGCAKWGRQDWIGQIYPEGTKEKDFFSIYAKNFNSIELNATHYRIPTSKTVLDWKSKVDTNFRFSPKFPQSISHFQRLKNSHDQTMSFYDAIKLFEENLGTSFLQMPPNYGPKNYLDFEKYIVGLPPDLKVCVEFRHKDWFIDSPVVNEAYQMMKEKGVGTVITDAAGRRDCVHQLLTSPNAFIRFVGNSLHPTDYTRVDDWTKRIKRWLDKGLKDVYFFMHQHDERHSPVLIDYSIKKLNKVCKSKLVEPKFVKKDRLSVMEESKAIILTNRLSD
jgi:uncharacterized protein YecE (DUF72 family)